MYNGIYDSAKSVKGNIQTIVRQEIRTDPDLSSAWKLRRAKVTSAPDGNTMRCGVLLVGESAPVYLPFARHVVDCSVGDLVLVAVFGNSLSNAVVWEHADYGVYATVGTGASLSFFAVQGVPRLAKLNMPLTQSGSGTPSATNVRPIENGNTVNLTFNGTTTAVTLQSGAGVFAAGTLDLLTGTLTVTHECLTLTPTDADNLVSVGSESNSYYSYLNISTANYGVSDAGICSHLAYANISSSNPVQGFRFNTASSNFRLFLNPFGRTPIANTRQWIKDQYNGGTPVQAAYVLTTPKTYTLTPMQVLLLTGNNTVSVDKWEVQIGYTTVHQY